jgi:hypothetical protein
MCPKITPAVGELRALLTEVTADLAQRSADAWHPAYGSSQARAEADEVTGRLRSDGTTPWGSAPVEVIWKAGELLSAAVLEYARAAAALMVPPFRVWAPGAEARAAVEAAAQLTWLLDPSVSGALTRVGRYYALRLYSARRLELTYSRVGPADPLGLYGKSVDDIQSEAASLGLSRVLNRKSEAIGYEGQKFPGLDQISNEITGANGAYSVLSGSSHSELWALLSGYQDRPASPFGLSAEEHAADAESLVPVVRVCLQALFKSLDCASRVFGRGALVADLQRLHEETVAALGN